MQVFLLYFALCTSLFDVSSAESSPLIFSMRDVSTQTSGSGYDHLLGRRSAPNNVLLERRMEKPPSGSKQEAGKPKGCKGGYSKDPTADAALRVFIDKQDTKALKTRPSIEFTHMTLLQQEKERGGQTKAMEAETDKKFHATKEKAALGHAAWKDEAALSAKLRGLGLKGKEQMERHFPNPRVPLKDHEAEYNYHRERQLKWLKLNEKNLDPRIEIGGFFKKKGAEPSGSLQ